MLQIFLFWGLGKHLPLFFCIHHENLTRNNQHQLYKIFLPPHCIGRTTIYNMMILQQLYKSNTKQNQDPNHETLNIKLTWTFHQSYVRRNVVFNHKCLDFNILWRANQWFLFWLLLLNRHYHFPPSYICHMGSWPPLVWANNYGWFLTKYNKGIKRHWTLL